ncbi:cell division protein ZapA [candidate division WOR-3 bacterium]|nr:cell division protein ZapA [candidate division WOR-3 bacterium]
MEEEKNIEINVFNRKYLFKIVDNIDKNKLDRIVSYIEKTINQYASKLLGKRTKEEILLLATLNITYDLLTLKDYSEEFKDKLFKQLVKLENECIN